MSEQARDGADLHLHTSFSDSTFDPEELVRRAAEAELAAIAVTDHDTVSGVRATIEAARGTGLDVVAGVEISSTLNAGKVHVVGLFIDIEDAGLLGELALLQKQRSERALVMLRNLREAGVRIEDSEILERYGKATIGRPHIAQLLYEKGYAPTVDEAYVRFIGDDSPAYVPNRRIEAGRAIALIHGAGGIAVLAHPGRDFGDERIAELARLGLDALEAWYPGYDQMTTSSILWQCHKHGLDVSGGSDCHGLHSGKGGSVGTIRIPLELKRKLEERRRANALRQT